MTIPDPLLDVDVPDVKPITVYGAAASGSVAVEAVLTILGLPYELVEGATWAEASARAVSPLDALRLLGNDLTVLDLYVTVVSRFGPWRARFYRAAPRMAVVVRRVDAEPELKKFWAERFPFEEGLA